MHKYLQWLFFFEKFEIQTKLSNVEVLEKIRPFTYGLHDDYTSQFTDDGFMIVQKPYTGYGILRKYNFFAPILKATVSETNGNTTISGILHMKFLVHCFLYFVCIMSLLDPVLYPVLLIILGLVYIGFFRPAHQLLDTLKELLHTDDTAY